MNNIKNKKRIKFILLIIATIVITSSITAYATSYFAKDITYKDGKTVESALNDLYNDIKSSCKLIYIGSKNITGAPGSGTFTFNNNYSNGVLMICVAYNYANGWTPGEDITYCSISNASNLTYTLLKHETFVSGTGDRGILDVYLLNGVQAGSSITCDAYYNGLIQFWG